MPLEINRQRHELKGDFVIALRDILDNTSMSREEWASYLNVSEAAISSWVNDLSFPDADRLIMIVNVIEKKIWSKLS